MSLDLNLISAVIYEKDFLRAQDKGIRGNHIEGAAEIQIWKFIHDYYQEYRSTPPVEVIKQKFDVALPSVSESLNYWIDEVKRRTLFNDMNEMFTSISEKIGKDDPTGAYSALRTFVKDKELELSTELQIKNVLDLKDAFLRAYDDAKAGVRGIDTPWKSMDEWTNGWWPKDLSFVIGRSGTGKCEAKGTKHLMYDGTIKKVEDLKVGDLLMGPDSKPRKVLSTCRGREEMFEVVPVKGEKWGCNRSHILSLKCSTDLDKLHRKGQFYEYSVDEYLSLPQRVRHVLKLWRTGVEFKEQPVEFDAYWLGLWLGDGTRVRPEITKDEPDLVPYYEDFCKRNQLSLKRVEPKDKCAFYTFTGQRGKVSPLLNFIRRCSKDGVKYIPSEYKVNSRRVRLELLAGLLDSDGSLASSNTFEITTKHEGLKEDILFVVRSLGFLCTWKRKKSTIRSTGFVGWYYRIFISGDTDQIPTKIKRKQAKPRKQIKNHLVTGFKLVSKGMGDYYGFTLDKDGLYLLWDFTVTHNTWFMLVLAIAAIKAGKRVLFISCEMSTEDISKRYFAMEIKKQYSAIRKGRLSFLKKPR